MAERGDAIAVERPDVRRQWRHLTALKQKARRTGPGVEQVDPSARGKEDRAAIAAVKDPEESALLGDWFRPQEMKSRRVVRGRRRLGLRLRLWFEPCGGR